MYAESSSRKTGELLIAYRLYGDAVWSEWRYFNTSDPKQCWKVIVYEAMQDCSQSAIEQSLNTSSKLWQIKTINGAIYDFRESKWLNSEHKLIVKEISMAPDIDTTLAERGSRYGSFEEHARITQDIKAAMKDSKNWDKLKPNQKECLEMIAHKVGRILNGDPNYHDSWHDIVGYTKLVADELLGDSK